MFPYFCEVFSTSFLDVFNSRIDNPFTSNGFLIFKGEQSLKHAQFNFISFFYIHKKGRFWNKKGSFWWQKIHRFFEKKSHLKPRNQFGILWFKRDKSDWFCVLNFWRDSCISYNDGEQFKSFDYFRLKKRSQKCWKF